VNEDLRPISVVIPAHNESLGIQRLLRDLQAGSDPSVEVIVVCNGCTDDTALRAQSVHPAIVVVGLPEPSKSAALAAGDRLATHAYRAWIDADVTIGADDLARLVGALGDAIHVAAPERELILTDSSVIVRWYYDVWRALPQVSSGVFGRGVVVMTPEGHARVVELPHVMSDDLAVSESFGADERVVVPAARVQIRAPKGVADLVRRRVRVATGNAQLDAIGVRTQSARTTPTVLLRLAASRPALAPKVLVFLSVTAVARVGARRRIRRGDFTTWLRDESSRDPSTR